jgi:hypothetical protein
MLAAMIHPLNWYAGWGMVLAGFLSGAALGIAFHREDFLGGYASFPRRLLRLGHIALVALGLLNVIVAATVPEPTRAGGASVLFIVGGITMPLICFLTAWKRGFRHLFFIPVLSLMAAVVLVLIGGIP